MAISTPNTTENKITAMVRRRLSRQVGQVTPFSSCQLLCKYRRPSRRPIKRTGRKPKYHRIAWPICLRGGWCVIQAKPRKIILSGQKKPRKNTLSRLSLFSLDRGLRVMATFFSPLTVLSIKKAYKTCRRNMSSIRC